MAANLPVRPIGIRIGDNTRGVQQRHGRAHRVWSVEALYTTAILLDDHPIDRRVDNAHCHIR